MLKKNYTKTGRTCRVTFKVPPELTAERAALLGEFNAWDAESHPLIRRKDGSHSLTISLEADREYRFRYLLDGERWVNDSTADGLVANDFGTQDGVIAV